MQVGLESPRGQAGRLAIGMIAGARPGDHERVLAGAGCYSSGKNRLKELGMNEGHIASPSLTEWSRRMPDAWSRTCPSGAI